jgi:hypothetical protein
VIDDIIKVFFLEEDGSGDGEEVILVSNERVMGEFSLCEGVDVVVVDDGLLKDLDHLVDAVNEFAHLTGSIRVVGEVTHHIVNESLLYLRQHAFGVAQVLLQDHRKFQKDL